MKLQVIAPKDMSSAWVESAVHSILIFYGESWPKESYTPWQRWICKVYNFIGKAYSPVRDLGPIKVFLTREPIPGRRSLAGLCVDPHTVFVRLNGLQRNLGETALAHELMHLCLWQWRGSPDVDHLTSYYLGGSSEIESLVRKADDTLRAVRL
jgi:hypothetical protein